MRYPSSSIAAARLIVVDQVESTNDELAARVAAGPVAEWPEFATLISDRQTAGRGRLGRSWTAPPGTMLAISVLLRPTRAGVTRAGARGWIPLIGGLAMTRALITLGARTELKWPNDVLIGARKVCGILTEVHPGDAVVVGSGVNLTLTEDDLPVPTATSMLLAGAETDADAVLAGYLRELRGLYSRFVAAEGDAEASGLRVAVEDACTTIGQEVRVQLAGAEDLIGVARGLDENGHLIIDSGRRRTAVSAGDVTHLRY